MRFCIGAAVTAWHAVAPHKAAGASVACDILAGLCHANMQGCTYGACAGMFALKCLAARKEGNHGEAQEHGTHGIISAVLSLVHFLSGQAG